MVASGEAELGLRERKKLEMRRVIGEAAIRLFAERGFDEVTVADVAAAVNVSEKTVFNYFATKEDLVVAGRADAEAGVVRAVRERAPGQSVLAAARAHALWIAERLQEIPAEKRTRWRKILKDATAVQLRMRQMTLQHEEELARVFREETGASESDPIPNILAGAVGLLVRTAYCGLTGWPSGRRLAHAEVLANIHRTFDLFERGLGDYGVRTRKAPAAAAR